MSDEVMLTTGDLSASSYYKIKGYADLSEFENKTMPIHFTEVENRLNNYIQYQPTMTGESLLFKADQNVNILVPEFTEGDPTKYLYKKVLNADLLALVNARNTLLGY